MSVAFASSACGSGAATGGGNGKASREIVYFAPSSAGISYLIAQFKGIKDYAKQAGYTVKFVLNNLDAAQQGQQVQQFVASGEKPAAIMIFPLDPKAGVNQAAQLSRIAPTFQINQKVAEGGWDYVKAYVGPSDALVGETAGKSLMHLRGELNARGTKLHSTEGNVLFIGSVPGTAQAQARYAGFVDATKAAPFNMLENHDCCSDAEKAYAMASQLIPKWKSKLDFIVTQNDDTANGIARALRQNGLEPGKDVWMVSGNCGGPASVLESKTVYATGLQSGYVEGAGMVSVISAYFASGKKIAPGEATLHYSEKAPSTSDKAPAQINILDNPPVFSADTASLTQNVWGVPLSQNCPLD
ncbi:sugar ABC transporter substrate-binding protein [Nocardioides terrisoli]|uniref:sugar ABC transporter substrate-binding protein n=1 Tax=Nocardioides terrisoli TaxID=3388267 RepID=UPI00287B7346|nr:sugar ABC transporter substrate-binding protein [Nocardioides marmorisolisilvae]